MKKRTRKSYKKLNETMKLIDQRHREITNPLRNKIPLPEVHPLKSSTETRMYKEMAVNSTIRQTRLSKNFNDLLFHIYLKSIPLDESFKLKHRVSLRRLFKAVIEAVNQKIPGLHKIKNNSLMLNELYNFAARRVYLQEENIKKIKGDKPGDVIEEEELDKEAEEFEEYDQSHGDDISELIMKKVVNVVSNEQETAKKEEEIQKEIDQSIQDMTTDPEELDKETDDAVDTSEDESEESEIEEAEPDEVEEAEETGEVPSEEEESENKEEEPEEEEKEEEETKSESSRLYPLDIWESQIYEDEKAMARAMWEEGCELIRCAKILNQKYCPKPKKSVFQQIHEEVAKSYIKHTESGNVNMDLILAETISIYTLFETLHTLKYIDFKKHPILSFTKSVLHETLDAPKPETIDKLEKYKPDKPDWLDKIKFMNTQSYISFNTINLIEDNLAIKLPKHYKICMKKYNGAKPLNNTVKHETYEFKIKRFISLSPYDTINIINQSKRVKNVFKKRYIPFALTEENKIVAFDYSKRGINEPGIIVLDIEKKRLLKEDYCPLQVTDSFDKFMGQLVH